MCNVKIPWQSPLASISISLSLYILSVRKHFDNQLNEGHRSSFLRLLHIAVFLIAAVGCVDLGATVIFASSGVLAAMLGARASGMYLVYIFIFLAILFVL